jgi:dihydroxyacetone kinase
MAMKLVLAPDHWMRAPVVAFLPVEPVEMRVEAATQSGPKPARPKARILAPVKVGPVKVSPGRGGGGGDGVKGGGFVGEGELDANVGIVQAPAASGGGEL